MRIGIDTTALPPQPVGAGQYIVNLVRALAALPPAAGEEIIVFAQQHGRRLMDIRDSQLRWVVIPDLPPSQRLVWEQFVLPRLARQNGLDLLHSLHYTRPLFLRQYAPRCASVVTFHDMTFFLMPQVHTRLKRLFFPPAIRHSARRADAIIAVSESTRQDAMRLLHIDPQRITTVPLGVNADFHPTADPERRKQVCQRYSLPPQFVLYVGLVEPRKNLPMLIRAYGRLVQDGEASHSPPPPLVIVGRMGWGAQAVIQQIEALGLKEQVHFTGYVSPQDLPIVYNLAEIFVYPSLYEGFGLPPLEAMACAAPVITTAVSSLPEHVGQAGLLIPPGDEGALAQALHSLLQDPRRRRELSILGPQQAAQFTWTRTAQETLQVYRRVLAQTQPA